MSASPAGTGPPSTTPNGGPAPGLRRKKPAGGPFAAKFKSTNRPPPARTVPPKPLNGTKPTPSAAKPAPAPAATVQAVEPDDDPSLYTEYPLVTTKRALLEGLRHHVMRFTAPDREVNPYLTTGDQFQRPVRLQRRFPHDTPKDPLPNATENPEDDKEREKEAIRKADRVAEREANQAQIAPTDKTAAAKKRQPFKKKTEDVYFPTDTPEAQKRAKLRYEEGRPWHLEDFSGKNSWVGTYEEPLSETHAMFALDAKGSFRVVPLEKWYRFAPTARYTTMNLDEAEMHMSKKMKQPRFYGEVGARAEEKNKAEDDRRKRLQETGRVGMRGENQRIKGEDDENKMDLANDVDEIDFEGAEEFQDDDENPLFAEDDDGREAERKIKEERHEANIFAGTGVKEDKDWDAEEEAEQKRLKEDRKLSKKLRKNLMKREKKFEYDSESDHPYSESSDSEDSDEERLREEEERKKKEEEAKANGDKPPSGASSKGTNTPSGRQEKQAADSLRNKSSIANLKRPGSPNLSEASGSESTHKRIKKEHGQRHMSGSLSPNAATSRRNPGSGSDTEASGTERRVSNKTLPGRPAPTAPSANATPSGSRSGTPAPGAAAAAAATGPMPTADEVRASVPPGGINIKDLVAKFKARVPKARNPAFIKIVLSVVKPMPGDKNMFCLK